MARIRTIKPEFWSHPIMARLPCSTQLLALALLNHADDYGYFHAEPEIIRAACCPFREDMKSIREDFAKLSDVGWIEVSEHPEQGKIGHVTKWDKHQKVDHPRPTKIGTYFSRENIAKVSEDFALDQGTGNMEQGKEQIERVAKAPRARFVPPSVDEVRDYCQERANTVDPERFVTYYESVGWMIGKRKIVSWKACVRTWEAKDKERKLECSHVEKLPTSERAWWCLGKTDIEPDDDWNGGR